MSNDEETTTNTRTTTTTKTTTTTETENTTTMAVPAATTPTTSSEVKLETSSALTIPPTSAQLNETYNDSSIVMLMTKDSGIDTSTGNSSLRGGGLITDTVVYPSSSISYPVSYVSTTMVANHSIAAEISTVPLTTTSSRYARGKLCTCKCNHNATLVWNITTTFKQKVLDNLTKHLRMNLLDLSSRKRKKHSAYDGRKSSSYIGASVASTVITLISVFIIGPDLYHLLSFLCTWTWIHSVRNRISVGN